MSDILDIIKERRSARSYLDKDISDEDLAKIAEAGMYAASGKGAQSPVIVIVKDKSLRNKLSKLNSQVIGTDFDPFYGAKVVAVVLANSTINTYVEDGSLAIGNMMLEATSLGISSCWVHRARQMFESEEGRKLLKEWGLSNDYIGVGNLVLGYSDGSYRDRLPRKKDYVIYK